MNLLIKCELTAPPSETGAFRSLTMFATIFRHYDCLIICEKNEVDFYYKWLKSRGSYDFVEDIILPNTEHGVLISGSRLTFDNLEFWIKRI